MWVYDFKKCLKENATKIWTYNNQVYYEAMKEPRASTAVSPGEPLELRIFRRINKKVLKKPALITSSREIYEKYRKISVSSSNS